MISEGQRNDINYAIPLLDQIEINGSNVLADRGYDSNKLLDYVYARGGEPTIPSRKGAKFERHCDWWLYKERHLVEKYFLKLKAFRRIATRYDKLAATYLGFICIAFGSAHNIRWVYRLICRDHDKAFYIVFICGLNHFPSS